MYLFFFFKQKTAYEIYQCDWSSDVCSSDLEYIGTIAGIKDEIRLIKEDDAGRVFMGTETGETYSLNISASSNESLLNPIINKYDTSNGLPSESYCYPYKYNGSIIFATAKGAYIYNKKRRNFVPDEAFNSAIPFKIGRAHV